MRTLEQLEKDDYENLTLEELNEYDLSCKQFCHLYGEFCSGGMVCYGGRVNKLFKRLNYVETSEPDRVAKELQQQDQRIAELEKENAELKQKLENEIVPKVKSHKANSQSFYGPFYSLPELNENNLIFATEQEARKELEELNNGKA